jgi:uncharacterized protein (TIGR02646 family)
MIKYEQPPKPSQLTEALQAKLTQKFGNDPGKAVWTMKWLKEAVLAKSFGKCCYSDIRLDEESKYMEIDHFFPKSIYPELVLEWNNLNPSCKTCNTSKSSHDPGLEPIVNPFRDAPKDYLYFSNYLYFGKDTEGKGKKTVEVLGLNDRKQFVEKRERVGSLVTEQLKDLYDNQDLFSEPHRKYVCKLKDLMRGGDRKESYAALESTVILEDNNFRLLETHLRKIQLWDTELDALKAELIFCALLR